MLTNYDARSVAEVMGIMFLQNPETHLSPAAGPVAKAGRDAKSPAGTAGAGLMMYVDGTNFRVVEVKAGQTTPRFQTAPSPILIEKAVEQGLPRQALRHVAEWLAGGDKTKASSLEWGIVPKTTLERRETQLSSQESERTERVARLAVHARRALGSEAEAREFMTTPHPQLEARSPLDAAMTDLGARRTERILNALEYGLAL